MSNMRRIKNALNREREAIATLLYEAEHWSTTGRTFNDLKWSRVRLFEAAYEYAAAVRALARLK